MSVKLNAAQKRFLKAVLAGNIALARKMLVNRQVKITFPAYAETTPLHEAVKSGNIRMVRFLVGEGFDVFNPAWDGSTAETLARSAGASRDIIDCLARERQARMADGWQANRRKTRKPAEAFNAAAAPKDKQEPQFTVKTLPEVFAAEKWVGRINEMQKLWEEVPVRMKKKFDFETALAEARRRTLKEKAPSARVVFKKKPPAQKP